MKKYPSKYIIKDCGINLFKINACIGGIKKGDYARIILLLDTGASFTMLNPRIITSLGYDINDPLKIETIVCGQGQPLHIKFIQTSWLNFAGKTLKNFPIAAFDSPNVYSFGCQGILGIDLLRKTKAVISVAKSQIYFI